MPLVSRLGRLLLVISVIVQLGANAISESAKGGTLNKGDVKLAVIVFACSRPSHLRRTLRSLASQDKSVLSQVDLYVSVDSHRKSRYVVTAAQTESDSLELPLRAVWQPTDVHHDGTPDLQLSSREKITAHYGRSLRRLFKENPGVTHAVILEDDLVLSPDFLVFLAAHAPYTSLDPNEGPTAISGWNDNSAAKIPPVPSGATVLTDFFPGLGWLLSRELWELLEPVWPDRRDSAPIMDVGRPTRPYPAARAAPTGWDWWLRAEFEAQRWIVLYPLLGRVSHDGGSSGATNVAVAQQKSLYANFKTADESSALPRQKWVSAARSSSTRYPAVFRAALEELVDGAKPIPNVEYAKRMGGKRVYRVAFTEMQYPKLASELALWPTPRAFFGGRLVLKLDDDTTVILERTAVLATRLEPVILAKRNESCAETCGGDGCIPAATTAWNNCTRLAQRFGCARGCIYETGTDIPAIVADDAPISTAGSCVVAEMTNKLSCEGKHMHTHRVCVCAGGSHTSGDSIPSQVKDYLGSGGIEKSEL